ncbi:hypothetical protein AGDE_16091 [Angomonas deanei]|nr:hypothetical protein AGDE_16091 [Angomonas deanei]|eukprot:EPY17725.1 hypothetical protein AGDE_16091 [Angomonas deanei]
MTIKRLKLAEEYLKKEVQFQLIRLKESYEVALRGEYHLQLLNLPYMEGEAERRTFSGSGASWQRLQGSSEEKTKKKKKAAVSDGTLLSVNMSDYTLSLKWLSGLEHQLRLLKERKSDIA